MYHNTIKLVDCNLWGIIKQKYAFTVFAFPLNIVNKQFKFNKLKW